MKDHMYVHSDKAFKCNLCDMVSLLRAVTRSIDKHISKHDYTSTSPKTVLMNTSGLKTYTGMFKNILSVCMGATFVVTPLMRND